MKSNCLADNNFYNGKLNQGHKIDSSNHHSLEYNSQNYFHKYYILPFTIGGFLYISLVGIIPEIIEEKNFKTSFYQILSFFIGILFIYCLIQIESIFPSLFI